MSGEIKKIYKILPYLIIFILVYIIGLSDHNLYYDGFLYTAPYKVRIDSTFFISKQIFNILTLLIPFSIFRFVILLLLAIMLCVSYRFLYLSGKLIIKNDKYYNVVLPFIALLFIPSFFLVIKNFVFPVVFDLMLLSFYLYTFMKNENIFYNFLLLVTLSIENPLFVVFGIFELGFNMELRNKKSIIYFILYVFISFWHLDIFKKLIKLWECSLNPDASFIVMDNDLFNPLVNLRHLFSPFHMKEIAFNVGIILILYLPYLFVFKTPLYRYIPYIKIRKIALSLVITMVLFSIFTSFKFRAFYLLYPIKSVILFISILVFAKQIRDIRLNISCGFLVFILLFYITNENPVNPISTNIKMFNIDYTRSLSDLLEKPSNIYERLVGITRSHLIEKFTNISISIIENKSLDSTTIGYILNEVRYINIKDRKRILIKFFDCYLKDKKNINSNYIKWFSRAIEAGIDNVPDEWKKFYFVLKDKVFLPSYYLYCINKGLKVSSSL